MDKHEGPRGQRVTRISFTLSTSKARSGSGSERLEQCEFAIGRTETGECIESLWCDVTPEFIIITMMVSPADHEFDINKTAKDLLAMLTRDRNETARKGRGQYASEEIENIRIAEIDAIMIDMISNVERIERRQKIYKVVDVIGPVELNSYIQSVNPKGFSMRKVLSQAKRV